MLTSLLNADQELQQSVRNPYAVALIDWYKEHLSGRYMFSGKRCTFQADTCSRYARRAFSEREFGEAYALTRERLRRCRDYKIYALDKKTLAWERSLERLVDEPGSAAPLVDSLRSKGESTDAIGHILKSAQAVHQYTCGAKSAELEDCIHLEHVESHRVKLRSAAGYKKYFRKELLKDVAYAAAAEFMARQLDLPQGIALSLGIMKGALQYYAGVAKFERFID